VSEGNINIHNSNKSEILNGETKKECTIKKSTLNIDYDILKMDVNIKTPFKVSLHTNPNEAYNNGFLNVIEHRNKYINKFFTEYNDHVTILNSLISKFKDDINVTSNKKYMYIEALYIHQGFNNNSNTNNSNVKTNHFNTNNMNGINGGNDNINN